MIGGVPRRPVVYDRGLLIRQGGPGCQQLLPGSKSHSQRDPKILEISPKSIMGFSFRARSPGGGHLRDNGAQAQWFNDGLEQKRVPQFFPSRILDPVCFENSEAVSQIG